MVYCFVSDSIVHAVPAIRFRDASFNLARRLLHWSPVVLLLFPQGTKQRNGIPEAIVACFTLVTLALVFFASIDAAVPLGLRRRALHPMLLLLLLYLLVLSPCWALVHGAAPFTVLVTVIGFAFLGAHHLLALSRAGRNDAHVLGNNIVVAACVVALLIITVGGAPEGAQTSRATGIASGGARTLMYPILPMGAVAAFTLLLFARHLRARYGLAFLLCTVAAVLTVTRAMILTMLAGCVLAVLATPFIRTAATQGHRLGALLRAVLIMGTGTLASVPWWSTWAERISPDSVDSVGTIVGRFEEISAFLLAFVDSPLLGRGIGSRIFNSESIDLALRLEGLTLPHNHLAFFAGTTGILGLVLYYWVVLSAPFGLCMAVLRRRVPLADAPMSLALGLAGLVGVAFTLSSTTYSTMSYNLALSIVIFASRTFPLDRPAAEMLT